MMQNFKRLLLVLVVLALAMGYRVYANRTYLMSFSFWNATNEDIAEAYVHDLEGVLLYEEIGFPPASVNRVGWITGSGAGAYRKVFPDAVLISWRKASPHETPAQRCRRRMEMNCELLGTPGQVMYGDGELIGPFRVDLRNRIPDKAWSLFRRLGMSSQLSFGISVGVHPPLVRWTLDGYVEGTSMFDRDRDFGKLAYGGDWGPYVPFGFENILPLTAP